MALRLIVFPDMKIQILGGSFMLVTLHSGDYQVSINSVGAELKSFRRTDGMEFIWNSDPKFWFRSSPLLFPGRTR